MKALIISLILFVSVSLFAAGNGNYNGNWDYDGFGGYDSGEYAPESGSVSNYAPEVISLRGYAIRYIDGMMSVYLSVEIPESAQFAVLSSSLNGGAWSEAASSIIIPQEGQNNYMGLKFFSIHEDHLENGDVMSYSVSFFSDPSRSSMIMMSEIKSFEY